MAFALTAYPGIGKRKGLVICKAFAQGCGGKVQEPGTAEWLAQGAAFFYGTTPDNHFLLEQARKEGRGFYYGDNAYHFGWETHFRVTRGALQHHGCGTADPARWRAFGLDIAPWQRSGRHVVVASQTDSWHLRHDGLTAEEWADDARRKIANCTDRPVRIIAKPHADIGAASTLALALQGAWALVVRDSSAAILALLQGVPVFTLAQCAATYMGRRFLDQIEAPLYPDDRERFFAVLAANQWTLDEMRSGKCWRDLHAG